MSIAIIDYGVGNLRSVEKAFTSQGIEAVVTSDESQLRAADKLVLPGVGAFKACMDGLKARGFDELVLDAAKARFLMRSACVIVSSPGKWGRICRLASLGLIMIFMIPTVSI